MKSCNIFKVFFLLKNLEAFIFLIAYLFYRNCFTFTFNLTPTSASHFRFTCSLSAGQKYRTKVTLMLGINPFEQIWIRVRDAMDSVYNSQPITVASYGELYT